MDRNEKSYGIIRLIILVSIGLYAYYQIAYEIGQTDFQELIIHYVLAFISFIAIYSKFRSRHKLLLGLSIGFRLLLFFATPELSQDIYRFIWDGHLIINGMNPYITSPDVLMQQAELPFGLADELYPKLTELSASNRSNYPPMSQFFYALSAWVSPDAFFGSILCLKAIILSADLLTYRMAVPILEHLRMDKSRVFLYLLNPLVIVEGMGNLHMEPLMVAFLLVGMFFWLKQRNVLSGIFIGFSIATKLLPLLLLPFMAKGDRKFQFKAFFKKDFFTISSISVVVTLAGFLFFIDLSNADQHLRTIGLWFNRFEFNASIYYVFRWIGYQVSGYNMIAYFGKGLAALSMMLLIYLALRSTANRKSQINAMLLALLAYFLLATTVHPWYLILPLALSIFSRYSFPVIVWSLSIFFSYHAYGTDGFQESTFWLFAEYALFFISILLLYRYPGAIDGNKKSKLK